MLYRTHHPLFYPFSHSTTSIPYPSTTATTALSLLQAQQGMDCVEGALKSSFRPEMAVKKTQQHSFLDDMWTVNCQGGVSGDDFVDELLDFSKGGMEDGFFEAEEERQHEQDTKACFASPQEQGEKDKDSDPTGNSFLVVDNFSSNPCSELSVPADDLANLEWLSHFVDDSFSEYSQTYPAGKLSENRTDRLSEPPEIPVPTNSSFTTPVHTKARSKRARTGGRVWLLASPSLTESSSSSSSCSSSSTTSSSHSNPWLIYNNSIQTADSLLALPQPSKKQKQKRETSGGSNVLHQPRRCSHCLVQKTPQWRTGPLGAKTLCNACGVRYKSGRLLPEYRPACSPTFSSDVHSNNHRKVLEMRRQKEVEVGLPPPVQSF